MASRAVPSATLLNDLTLAEDAARAFIVACKDAFVPPGVLNATFGSTGNNSDSSEPTNTALTEEVLRNWRDACDILRTIFSEDYFVPENVFDLPAGFEFDAKVVNLALILDTFLPENIRHNYRDLTNEVPLVDDGDLSGESESVINEKVLNFATPLSELKLVYLKLCAGRSEKHVQWVVRQLIVDLCTTQIMITNRAYKHIKREAKARDLRNTFRSSFLKEASLVPSVFTSPAAQSKAITTWEAVSGDRVTQMQLSVVNAEKYSWEKLCQSVLSDALRHIVPIVCGERVARVEGATPLSARQTSSIDHAVNDNSSANNGTSTNSLSKYPTKRNVVSNPRTTALPTTPANSNSKQVSSLFTSHVSPVGSTSVADRIITSAINAHFGRTNDVMIAGTPTFDLIDNSNDQILSDNQTLDMNGDEDEDAEGEVVEEQSTRQLAISLKAPAPVPQIPKNFKFNARQANAVRITMTPSPPSSPPKAPKKNGASKSNREESTSAKGDKRGPGSKSVVNKVKKTVAAEMERTRTLSTGSKGSTAVGEGAALAEPQLGSETVTEQAEQIVNDQRAGNSSEPHNLDETTLNIERKRKRKADKSFRDDDSDFPQIKKRKVDDGTLPPVHLSPPKPSTSRPSRPAKPSAASSATTRTSGQRLQKIALNSTQETNETFDGADFNPGSGTETETETSGNEKVQPKSKPAASSAATTTARRDARSAPRVFSSPPDVRAKVVTQSLFTDDENGDDSEDWPALQEMGRQNREARRAAAKEREADSGYDSNASALERSKASLATIKNSARMNTPPTLKRDRNPPRGDSDEDDLPRRKQGKNRYRTGRNESGRVRWTADEDRALLFALEGVYARKIFTKPWKDIETRHGANGIVDKHLANRNCMQLKDRARNICLGYNRRNEPLPVWMSWITMPSAQPKKTSSAPHRQRQATVELSE